MKLRLKLILILLQYYENVDLLLVWFIWIIDFISILSNTSKTATTTT